MSTEKEKLRKSKRIHRTESAVKRQVKIAKQKYLVDPDKFVDQPHRYHKRHAMDCGRPGCMLCGNRRKLFKELTQQEKSLFQDLDNIRDTHSNGLNKDEEDLL